MKIVKVGFYHHGALPSEKDRKALAGINVSGRNAERFNPKELENFDTVVVDDGPNTKAIKSAYGVRAVSIADFVKKTPASPAPEAEVFDPDAKAEKPESKTQGK